ncbi:putative Flp pilus-assembly TadE/G-like protein [Hoeflea halophila]|uniref:Putative Flp pilus-assembly TadE/G-like protein n=1 Tax=Hoeflea halophila TaxID=714899 RepID=A0A286HMA3_9HYPH|nr:TadE/TadG family type IV pilus assembly protein [Hoeflea halophila]SOE08616.1 putative Flp pilus-assembly TadE/G-like protein [Hoeflea halophila]
MMKPKALFTASSLVEDRGGNFAIAAALTIPLLFMAGSLAVDTTNAISMKTQMQNAVDSAALATSTRLANDKGLSLLDAKSFAEKFLNGQLQEAMNSYQAMAVKPTVSIIPTINGSSTAWKVSIVLEGSQAATPMARFLGHEKTTVKVAGTSESASGTTKGSVSLMLVLDKSGSMGWDLGGQVKMNVLKTAVIGLLTELKLADPEEKYVRIGGVSYDTKIDKKQGLKWGTDYAGKFVGKLEAKGGTDSTDAFKWAHEKVTYDKEDKEHLKETGQTPTKYIVLMTDGDNNYVSADTSTKILCDKAKKDGVKVYSVAFAAPDRGKQLLSYCASSGAHFFDAKDSAELIAAFKNIGQQASKVVSRLTQ